MATPDNQIHFGAAKFEWALRHIEKYGDTDFLPLPIEYAAIRSQWTALQKWLVSVDFAQYRPTPPRRFLVPKPGNGFRVVHHLDPMDALIYTTAVYDVAETIEAHRVPQSRKVACSYRVAISPDGSFFANDDGWSDFHAQSKVCIEHGGIDYVAVADIADYYNQIYIHRVETSLEAANVPEDKAQAMEEFLLHLGGAKQSQGIPVGPAGSIILAEAVLNEIDTLLMKKGFTHVRYVDDFRIFCPDRAKAYEALHHLTDHLYTVHRLSLQPLKSCVMSVKKFSMQELHDPHEQEEREKKSHIQTLIEEIRDLTGYNLNESDLPKDHINEAVRDSILELFNIAIAAKPIHTGLVRYLLRRARELRTAIILKPLMDHLEILTPVFRDVCRYLRVVLTKKNAEDYGQRLLQFTDSNPLGVTPFIRFWILWLFAERTHLLEQDKAFELASDSQRILGLRPITHIMMAHKQVDWIRSQKETIATLPAWDRRPLISACRLLPKKERKSTLEAFIEGQDQLDMVLAQDALGS